MRMRTARFLVLALVASMLLLALTTGPARRAEAACSIGATDYHRAGLNAFSHAANVVLGTVASERSIPRPPNTQEAWESVVVVEVVLKGDVGDEPLRIPYIGFLGGDCSGGPRLRVGERVLIPVFWGQPSYGDGEEGWQLHGIFSKVLFDDGLASLEWSEGREALGDAEDVVRSYGEAAGATDVQIEAAIAAALTSAPRGSSDVPWLIIAVALAALAVVAVFIAVLRSGRLNADS
jgi:hypothetical protein